MLSHAFWCDFNQAVFENSYSEKRLRNIKNKRWHSDHKLVGKFLWSYFNHAIGKSLTKTLNKLQYRTNILRNIFYSAIFLNIG